MVVEDHGQATAGGFVHGQAAAMGCGGEARRRGEVRRWPGGSGARRRAGRRRRRAEAARGTSAEALEQVATAVGQEEAARRGGLRRRRGGETARGREGEMSSAWLGVCGARHGVGPTCGIVFGMTSAGLRCEARFEEAFSYEMGRDEETKPGYQTAEK